MSYIDEVLTIVRGNIEARQNLLIKTPVVSGLWPDPVFGCQTDLVFTGELKQEQQKISIHAAATSFWGRDCRDATASFSITDELEVLKFDLYAKLAAAATLDFPGFELSAESIGVRASIVDDCKFIVVEIAGLVNLGDNQIEMAMRSSGDLWIVTAQPKQLLLDHLPGGGLASLSGLIGSELENTSVVAGFNSDTVEFVQIEANLPNFTLPIGLKITKGTAEITIDNPLDEDNRSFHGQISCTALIKEDLAVDAWVQLPDLRFEALIEKLDLSDIASDICGGTLNVPEDAEHVTFQDVRLTADVERHELSFFALSDKLRFGKVELNDIDINASVIKSDEKTEVSGHLGATLRFGADEDDHRVDLRVWADLAEQWTFNGSTGAGQKIPLGKFVEHLASDFVADGITLPKVLEGLIVENFDVSFKTGTKDLHLSCLIEFPVSASKNADLELRIDLNHQGEYAYQAKFGGQLLIGDYLFDLHFDQTKDTGKHKESSVLLASYSHKEDAVAIELRGLVEHVSGDLAELVPVLALDIKDIFLAVTSAGDSETGNDQEESKGLIIGLDLGSKLDLSELPIVSHSLPEGNFGIDDLRVLVASRDLSQDEVDEVNGLLPKEIANLETADDSRSTKKETTTDGESDDDEAEKLLPKGVHLCAKLDLAGTSKTVHLDFGEQGDKANVKEEKRVAQLKAEEPEGGDSGSEKGKWIKLQKSVGPVYFARAGLQYKEKELWLLLDASLTGAGVTLSLDGLSIHTPLDHFQATPELKGLGIDYKSGPAEIGGELLYEVVDGNERYAGEAILKTEAFSLMALGAYEKVGDDTSMLVYGVLDKALGGPPVAFVTGLAAAFGYNRGLVSPPIDKVADFPLVKAVVGNDKSDLLNELQKSLPVSVGDTFLAAGAQFTSFKLIDTVALLMLVAGERCRVDLVGLSTMKLPPGKDDNKKDPLAEVQMALKASIFPDEGFMGIDAQLTSNSYILSKKCHLTGGFAFYSWFSGKHAGDFVVTLGGYHPEYRKSKPSHYPDVPALGINWQVTSNLSIKGDAYFALTPSTLMAGGHMEAAYHSGNIKASFKYGVDFLIAWKPCHYQGDMHVNVGASYKFSHWGIHHTFSADVGADLHVWGPEFSGTARVHLSVVSFTIAFGNASKVAKPIPWAEFKDSFLPKKSTDQKQTASATSALAEFNVCTLSVADGLLTTRQDGEGTETWIVNPKTACIVVETAIPATTIMWNEGNEIKESTTPEGKPVKLDEIHLRPCRSETQSAKLSSSTLKVKLTSEDKGRISLDNVELTPRTKSHPTGLWGGPQKNGKEDPLIESLSGLAIQARTPELEGKLKIGEGAFFGDRHKPPLAAGKYELSVTHAVKGTVQQDSVEEVFKSSQKFEVRGPRLSLNPNDVLSVFPPAGSLGDHGNVFPHIVLRRSTLPWERELKDTDDAPWIALLLFDEKEAPEIETKTGEVLESEDSDRFKCEGDELQKSRTIKLGGELLKRVAPSRDDLKFLAHVRKRDDGEELAVVVGNRLPRSDGTSVVHLVSLEGLYSGTEIVLNDEDVRLVSLSNWQFSCIDTNANLDSLLANLEKGCEGLDCVTPPSEKEDAEDSRFYRSPLTIQPRDTGIHNVPRQTFGRITPIHDQSTANNSDVSDACAWALGRQLALQDRVFAFDLYRYVRGQTRSEKTDSQIQQVKHLVQSIEYTRLRMEEPEEPVLSRIRLFLNDLSSLKGLPFRYLVPDHSKLPPESIRFFRLDKFWVDRLLNGALSIAWNGQDNNSLILNDIRKTLEFENMNEISGFLMRSEIVAGWPDLIYTAIDEIGDNEELSCLRNDRLSPVVLMAMFKGNIDRIEIAQKPEDMHFEIQENEKTKNRVLENTTTSGRSAAFAKDHVAEPKPFTIQWPISKER